MIGFCLNTFGNIEYFQFYWVGLNWRCIPIFYLLFPRQRHLSDKSKSNYVDTAFRLIASLSIVNIKNEGYSAQEIAVIVGHGNDITASEHYGKKRSGQKVALPIANEKDLPKIKQKLEQKLVRLARYHTIDNAQKDTHIE